MTKSKAKKSRNQERKQLRKQGQTPKKQKKVKGKKKTVTKSVTDFTHALGNVTTREDSNQRLLMTKCEFPIIHSKIVDEETNMLKVRKTPLVIKRNNKVTCPRCKKKLDNFLVAFRKRRMRPIRNFSYRVSQFRLPKLKIGEKRREKKRLRLMALIEDQALDNFFNSMVKGIKDWRKFVEKHHKERYDEYLSLIYIEDEDEDIILDEEELVFDEDDDISTKKPTKKPSKKEVEEEATDDVEFDNDQEEEEIEGQETEDQEEQEDDLEIVDEGEQEEEQEEEQED